MQWLLNVKRSHRGIKVLYSEDGDVSFYRVAPQRARGLFRWQRFSDPEIRLGARTKRSMVHFSHFVRHMSQSFLASRLWPEVSGSGSLLASAGSRSSRRRNFLPSKLLCLVGRYLDGIAPMDHSRQPIRPLTIRRNSILLIVQLF
jgi:hypothetical protein